MNALLLAALLETMRADADMSACSASELHAAAARADITPLGTLAGRDVVLAAVEAPCFCGNVNCPFLVLRRDGAHARVLLSTDAYDVRPIDAAQPLPRLRERAHDSALISYETVDAFRDGAYVPVSVERLRDDTGERKPDRVPLVFAPGASAATVRGAISFDWYDRYVVRAARGQRLTVTALSGRGVTATLETGPATWHRALVPGRPLTLPVSGSYDIMVETQRDERTPYTLTLAIR